ncbi:tetratricopeptide repeat protein [Tenacibaculum sp. 190524A02b]|uniref:tetratricopeptide repeat-containing sensor histidine kinase n=1 Tax=Tenacibaculum vairaonense TaxID=3137860 RepID=UPI0031FAC493
MKNSFFLVLVFLSTLMYAQNTDDFERVQQKFKQNEYNNLKIAYEIALEGIALSKKVKDSTLLMQSYHNLAVIYLRQKKINKVYDSSEKCLNIAKKLNNPEFIAKSYNKIAVVKRKKGNYKEALAYHKKAISITNGNEYDNLRHKITNSIANLYKTNGDYKRAKKLLKEQLKNNKTDIVNRITSFNILGNIFKREKKKDSSVYYFTKALLLAKKTKNKYYQEVLHTNIAYIYLEEKKLENVKKHLIIAEKIGKEIFSYANLFHINIALGAYLDNKKKYAEAIEKYKRAVEKYSSYVSKYQKLKAYDLIYSAYYRNKQFKETCLYQEKFILLKDSLFTEKKNKEFERLKTEYEVEKKNSKIQLLKKEKALESQRKKLILIVGLLLLIPAILIAFMYRNRVLSQKTIRAKEAELHQKEKEQLQQEQKIKRIEGYVAGEEKEKNRIALELHDGIGGQLSGIKHYATSLEDSKEKTILLKDLSNVTKDIRLLSHSLSSSYSMQQPLTDLLQVLQEQYKNHFKITISIYPEEALQKISDKTKHFLHRTLQELINNIYKHANANLVTISLTIIDDIVLMIEDNGIGFDTSVKSKGIGLHNIQERVDNLQGQLSIDSTSRHGTTIIVKIPIHLGNKN